jgi:Acetyltransferase (GNAT) domain
MTDVLEVSPPRRAGVVADVVEGAVAVRRLLPAYEELAEPCRLPVTARAAWIRAGLDADPTASPWAAVVRDRDGALRAAAILLDQPDGGAGRVVLAAGGNGYRAGVAAIEPADAQLLGAAIARRLARRASRPVLDLGPLPVDARTDCLAAGLGAAVVPCDPVPAVRRDRGEDVSAYLSHGTRKTLRKARNRLATDELEHCVRFTDDADAVAELLPHLEDAYRDRDREHGLPCPLDTVAGRALWRGRIDHLLAIGSLEVATLWIAGRPVAYVVGVHDGRRYGVLEGRFLTAWSRYAPGRLLEAAVLQRVLADDRFEELDWMTGIASETLLATNAVEHAVAVRFGDAPSFGWAGALS